ncbi:ester cyclase [Aliiglaciecola sp. NS0011-25]|uniref:ester cyclase n=1 Tax=Aliiglaciecola sp. NS0011-25 TaxID=3127654 RepID=UPI0031046312
MSNINEIADLFFDACETGKGWDACKEYCHPNATFSAQAEVLADIGNLESYTEWMKGLLTAIPDGHYEMKSFSTDETRNCVTAFGIFHGTQTGPSGSGEPTGKVIAADYVYAMQFEDQLISHVTKIWNDSISLQQLGWA